MISYRYDARSRDNPRFWHFSAGDADAVSRVVVAGGERGSRFVTRIGLLRPLAAFHVHGSNVSSSCRLVRPGDNSFHNVSVSQANGSTPFNFADCTSVAMMAQ